MSLVSLMIRGMRCIGCEKAVEAALSRLPGVTNVKADHRTGYVKVEMISSSMDTGFISDTLQTLGFSLSF
ncbi:MAG: heavy-metal-associated domain-containing protein [Calditrichaeota bacterium]|nr:heavy-metal-associated domain-containing protein [Calditrichota bacterium]